MGEKLMVLAKNLLTFTKGPTSVSKTELLPWAPGDAISSQETWLTLDRVMACSLTARIHWLNQCHIIFWHTPEDNLTRNDQ